MTQQLDQVPATAPHAALLAPDELSAASELVRQVLRQLDQTLLGREQLHRMVLVGILSRGHILLEGLPGVGKTALIKALGQTLHLAFNRVQFTPDLMPSDILGTHILREAPGGGREMTFQPGPVFTNILLADEINRASPKTQSALLEAMQESSVTLLGQTRELPRPFFVLASQNPIELEGTYPLPEAQLDRFLFKLSVSGVNVDVLTEIIATRRRGEPPAPTQPLSAIDLERLFATMERIYLPRPVCRYISRLVAATHPRATEATTHVNAYVTYGASPRAAIAMAEAARGHALVDGRPSAGFEDVRAVAAPVLNHRLILNYKARFDQIGTLAVIEQLLDRLDEAELNLPADVRIEPADEVRA
ncbi:MAG TPA: AAA family ATPase [Pirellulales bacterium]|jgi:MoxR-like ATPase|nr:AAA family ATPase [Pirellulales bacterium]